MKLFSYWRSSAAWRVRIALALKNMPHQVVPVSLIANGGEQHAAPYVELNPQHLVPTLITDEGAVLTQSLAIIDWLEQVCPTPALLPKTGMQRAKVLAAAHIVAMDIHPINNLRVLNMLGSAFGADAEAKTRWMQHWMREGFDALEKQVAADPFCFGSEPGLADICLVPQLYNARRWKMDISAWPKLAAIEARCLAHAAFSSTAPEAQPDAT